MADRAPDPGPGAPGVPAAGDLLRRRVDEQVAELRRREDQVRYGDRPTGVHRARVSCRRLRSALVTFDPLLDPITGTGLRRDLRWLARRLGAVRDLDVVEIRLLHLVEQTGCADPGPARRYVLEAHQHDRAEAERALERALDSRRHAMLLTALEVLATAPPAAALAQRPATEVVPGLVRAEWDRLARGMDLVLGGSRTGDHLDRTRHAVRKDAKRLRYAAEVAAPLWPDAAALADAAARVTAHLGERQDIVMSARVVTRLEASATAAGSATAWAAVREREATRADHLDAELPGLWAEVAPHGDAGWLQVAVSGPGTPSSC